MFLKLNLVVDFETRFSVVISQLGDFFLGLRVYDFHAKDK